jgi:hypothetical protein
MSRTVFAGGDWVDDEFFTLELAELVAPGGHCPATVLERLGASRVFHDAVEGHQSGCDDPHALSPSVSAFGFFAQAYAARSGRGNAIAYEFGFRRAGGELPLEPRVLGRELDSRTDVELGEDSPEPAVDGMA